VASKILAAAEQEEEEEETFSTGEIKKECLEAVAGTAFPDK
jgi:hypothetical protein